MFMSRRSAALPKPNPTEELDITTIRSFDGGLNVVDTDLNMAPKFARVLDNVERNFDGSLSVRRGTRLFANLEVLEGDDDSNIINNFYFQGYIIAVQASGRVTRTDGSGVSEVMLYDNGTDPPYPPWPGPVEFVSFTIFNNDLIIANGVDKPLLIYGDPGNPLWFTLDFLKDIATDTNINTPIAKFVITHNKYVVMAGMPSFPTSIIISNKETSGTWVGDDPPNDSVLVDLGPRVSKGSANVTGIVSYRDKMIVTFEQGVLPMNLGIYTGDPLVHTPTDDGFVEEFGNLSHRTLISVGDDTYYCDNVGVNSIARTTVFNTLRPVRASQLIDPLITQMVQPLTADDIANRVFAVYDLRNSRYMLFVPDADLPETVGFSFTTVPQLKVAAWARLRGWNWQCGCRTALQNIIFARGAKMYSYAFDDNEVNADYVDDDAVWDGAGAPIEFTWELPWADFKNRMRIKQPKYIGLDVQGTGAFTLNAYVDNITEAPMLEMNFVGGDADGYGLQPYGVEHYGGGRRTTDERLWAWGVKFKLLKLQFYGSTRKPLKFVSISIAYLRGRIRR